jgi:hypothetical protein
MNRATEENLTCSNLAKYRKVLGEAKNTGSVHVKFSLCLTKHHAIITHGGLEV